MLYTIAVVLLILWLLGFVSGYTIGAFIHVLLVIALVLVLVQFLSGRRVVWLLRQYRAPVAAVMAAITAAAGVTRVDTNMKDRASTRRENVLAIDRWEDEGGSGESPAKNTATPRSMPNASRRRRVSTARKETHTPNNHGAPVVCRPLTIRRLADSWSLLNADGKRDLIYSGYNSNLLQVLLGFGAGGFVKGWPLIGLAAQPQGLGTADFNRDGHLDRWGPFTSSTLAPRGSASLRAAVLGALDADRGPSAKPQSGASYGR